MGIQMQLSSGSPHKRKKSADQGRSSNPAKGHTNSTGPTPLSGRGVGTASYETPDPCGSSLAVFEEAETHARHSNCHVTPFGRGFISNGLKSSVNFLHPDNTQGMPSISSVWKRLGWRSF
jgi:hypothetical protein